MKKIISISITLILLGVFSFLIYQNIDLKKKKLEILPRISTEYMPQATKGQYYETEVFAFLIGAKSPIDITLVGDDNWLEIKDCISAYNNEEMPKPNTVTSCKLVGYPIVSGSQEIELSASSKGFAKKSIYKLPILISK